MAGSVTTKLFVLQNGHEVSAGASGPVSENSGLSPAPGAAKKLGLFSRGSIHMEGFPPYLNEAKELFDRLHANTIAIGRRHYESRGFVDGAAPNPMKPLDPIHLGHGSGVFAHMQIEQMLPGSKPGEPVKAFRQAVKFDVHFTSQFSQIDISKAIKNIQITFEVSEPEAKAFFDILGKLNTEFRAEHQISKYADVKIAVNGLTQLVTGPVKKDAKLLMRHTDGPVDQTHTTLLMRGPDSLNPLHKVVMFPEDGSTIEKTTGMVVFNGVSHEVIAAYDSEGPTLSATVAIGIFLVPDRSFYAN